MRVYPSDFHSDKFYKTDCLNVSLVISRDIFRNHKMPFSQCTSQVMNLKVHASRKPVQICMHIFIIQKTDYHSQYELLCKRLFKIKIIIQKLNFNFDFESILYNVQVYYECINYGQVLMHMQLSISMLTWLRKCLANILAQYPKLFWKIRILTSWTELSHGLWIWLIAQVAVLLLMNNGIGPIVERRSTR